MPMIPVPATPVPDPTAADTTTLEGMGVIPEQPEGSPDPPPPPVYETLASPA